MQDRQSDLLGRPDCVGGGLIGHNFEEIISLDNLLAAWREFRRGKSCKSDVLEYEFNLERNLLQLHHELSVSNYQPSPYKSFYVSDPKLRHIHKAIVRDRVVHQSIYRKLSPIFERHFIFDSYSCRIDKGSHRAVRRLADFSRRASANHVRVAYGLKCDIRKFFDSVNHEILRKLIAAKLTDKKVLALLDKIIFSYSWTTGRGLPLGNVTSQLFGNIYLDVFDQFVKHELKRKYYLRYTDDFMILGHNENELLALVPYLDNFLFKRLALHLHPDKTEIRKFNQGLDFLGYVVRPFHRVLRTKTKHRILKKAKQKKEIWLKSEISKEVYEQSRQSYYGLLKHCAGKKILGQM